MFFVSCSDNSKILEKKFLEHNIEKLDMVTKYNYIMILPGVGCHGCIQDGEFYMKKNITRKDILFIVTKVSSMKILQQKLGFDLKGCTNVFVDRDNIFDIPSENSIYPCVIELKNGKIINYAFQSPKSNAFNLLK